MKSKPPISQQRQGWSLRHSLLFALAFTFISIFGIVEMVLLYGLPHTHFRGSLSEQEQIATDHLADMADARKGELERWLGERLGNLRTNVTNPSLKQDVALLVRDAAGGAAEAARQRLRHQLANLQEGYFGEYELIEILDAVTGTVLVSTKTEEEGHDHGNAPYFTKAINPAVEEVVMAAQHPKVESFLVFARAIQRPDSADDNNILAVLVFHNSMRKVIDSILHRGIGQTGEVVMMDHTGRLVAPLRYPLPEGYQAFVNKTKPAQEAIQGIEGQLVAKDYRGVEVLAATRYLRVTSDLGLGLVVKIDQAEVLAPIRQLFIYRLSVGILAVTICAAIIFVLVTLYTRPLARLSLAAGLIKAGDFTVRNPVAGSREMRMMADAFNAMAERLEHWHAELTSEVKRRTHELTVTNIALAESEQRFRSLFENVHVVSLLIDPATGAILDANLAATAFYGWSRAELQAMTIGQINILSSQEIEAAMAEATQEARSYFEFRHRLADGTEKEVEVYSGLIQSGEQTLLCSIVHDITLRKQAEEERERLESQLLQAQKMESVGRLAGGVAHDFNNMLTVILGNAAIILHEMEPDHPFRDDLTEIKIAAERSATLTRQLLAFARKQVITPKVIDLNETVESMLKMIRRLIGENIDLVWQPNNEVWSLKMDPAQIDQILANLCVNARDAIAGVGKLTIETDNASLDEAYCRWHAGSVPGDYVLLVLSDNGCGMDAETISLLFEPFFTTKEFGKGTGLGLATVYGIVKQNHGFINVYSEPGQGTTFRIYLPRHAAKAVSENEAGQTLVTKRGRETILLVEDKPAILKMTTRMIEREGYTVLAASRPGEAIRLAQEHAGEIHLLLTDVVMPELNGRDLAKNILSLYPQIKCLFMSGYTADVIADLGVLDEGVNFIQKPFSIKDLTEKLRKALDG